MEVLNSMQIRVLAALVEKSLTTPDYYPMTVNSLLQACNQKTSRDPVTSFTEVDVTDTLDSLLQRRWVSRSRDGRVPKWLHLFDRQLELSRPEMALLTVLCLRGPQTAGELKNRTQRLYEFASLEDVQNLLDELTKWAEPFVLWLPREPGRKEPRCTHLLGGMPDLQNYSPEHSHDDTAGTQGAAPTLREEVTALKQELENLRSEFDLFRKEFE